MLTFDPSLKEEWESIGITGKESLDEIINKLITHKKMVFTDTPSPKEQAEVEATKRFLATPTMTPEGKVVHVAPPIFTGGKEELVKPMPPLGEPGVSIPRQIGAAIDVGTQYAAPWMPWSTAKYGGRSEQLQKDMVALPGALLRGMVGADTDSVIEGTAFAEGAGKALAHLFGGMGALVRFQSYHGLIGALGIGAKGVANRVASTAIMAAAETAFGMGTGTSTAVDFLPNLMVFTMIGYGSRLGEELATQVPILSTMRGVAGATARHAVQGYTTGVAAGEAGAIWQEILYHMGYTTEKADFLQPFWKEGLHFLVYHSLGGITDPLRNPYVLNRKAIRYFKHHLDDFGRAYAPEILEQFPEGPQRRTALMSKLHEVGRQVKMETDKIINNARKEHRINQAEVDEMKRQAEQEMDASVALLETTVMAGGAAPEKGTLMAAVKKATAPKKAKGKAVPKDEKPFDPVQLSNAPTEILEKTAPYVPEAEQALKIQKAAKKTTVPRATKAPTPPTPKFQAVQNLSAPKGSPVRYFVRFPNGEKAFGSTAAKAIQKAKAKWTPEKGIEKAPVTKPAEIIGRGGEKPKEIFQTSLDDHLTTVAPEKRGEAALHHKDAVAEAIKSGKLTRPEYDPTHSYTYGRWNSTTFKANFPAEATRAVQTSLAAHQMTQPVEGMTWYVELPDSGKTKIYGKTKAEVLSKAKTALKHQAEMVRPGVLVPTDPHDPATHKHAQEIDARSPGRAAADGSMYEGSVVDIKDTKTGKIIGKGYTVNKLLNPQMAEVVGPDGNPLRVLVDQICTPAARRGDPSPDNELINKAFEATGGPPKGALGIVSGPAREMLGQGKRLAPLENPELEKFVVKNLVPRDVPSLQKVLEKIRYNFQHSYVPPTKEYAPAKEKFLQWEHAPQYSADFGEMLKSWVWTNPDTKQPCSPHARQVFSNLRFLLDRSGDKLLWTKKGEGKRIGSETREMLKREIDLQYNQLKTPGMEGVKAEVEGMFDRKTFVETQLRKGLTTYCDVPESRFDNTYWMHHMIQEYDLHEYKGSLRSKRAGSTLSKIKSPALFKRKPSEKLYGYQTDPYRFDAEVYGRLFTEIVRGKTLKFLKNDFEIRYKAEASVRNEDAKKRGDPARVTWQEVAGEHGAIPLYINKAMLFPYAYGLTESAVQKAVEAGMENSHQLLKSLALVQQGAMSYKDAAGVKRMSVFAGRGEAMWLPVPLARQVLEFERGMGNVMQRYTFPVITQMTNMWKMYVLLNPVRAVRYNVQNWLGDLDAVMMNEPRILTEVWPAFKDLYQYHIKGQRSPDVLKSLAGRVVDNTQTTQEIPTSIRHGLSFKRMLSNFPGYQQMTPGEALKRGNPISAWFRTARTGTVFRENILRLAAYKYAKKQIAAGKTFTWASNPKLIEGLTDPELRACRLALDLLGDYGNITRGGQFLRATFLPFWSFQEINWKRIARTVANQFHTKNMVASMPVKAARVALQLGRLAVLSQCVIQSRNVFNYISSNLLDVDLDKVPSRDEAWGYFLVGKNREGNPVIERAQGSVEDLMEWVGINELVPVFQELIYGIIRQQITPNEAFAIAAEAIKQDLGGTEVPQNVAARFVNLLSPFPKAALELGFKKSTFPDIFHPSSIRNRTEYFMRMLYFQDFYDGLHPYREVPDKWWLRVTGVKDVDYKEGAYYDIQEAKKEFLDEIGEGGIGDYWRQTTNPKKLEIQNLYYLRRLAIKRKQPECVKKIEDRLRTLGVTRAQMIQSLNTLDPRWGIKKYYSRWMDWLDQPENAVLKKKYEWSLEWYDEVVRPNR